MNFRRVFLIGAVIGALVSGLFAPSFFTSHWFISYWWPLPWAYIPIWLCPFYILLFLMGNITRSVPAIVTIAIIGDAFLYGLLAMLCLLLYRVIRRIGGGPKRRTQNLA